MGVRVLSGDWLYVQDCFCFELSGDGKWIVEAVRVGTGAKILGSSGGGGGSLKARVVNREMVDLNESNSSATAGEMNSFSTEGNGGIDVRSTSGASGMGSDLCRVNKSRFSGPSRFMEGPAVACPCLLLVTP